MGARFKDAGKLRFDNNELFILAGRDQPKEAVFILMTVG
jgi:hypothetical protein